MGGDGHRTVPLRCGGLLALWRPPHGAAPGRVLLATSKLQLYGLGPHHARPAPGGEGWHDIMFGAFDALASLWPAAYFLSFIALNTLLFSSIFVGIVCDTFEAIQRRS